MLGEIILPLEVEGRSLQCNFKIVPDSDHTCVLGIDILSKNKFVMDLGNGRWKFEEMEDFVNLALLEADNSIEGIVQKYRKLFKDSPGITHLMECKIEVKDETPLRQRNYPMSPYKLRILHEKIDELLASGKIEESSSDWSSPVLLVMKPSGDYRLVCDLRSLNSVMRDVIHPMSRIDSILDKLGKSRVFSKVDLRNGYWMVPLSRESRKYTAFMVPGRPLLQWRVMPQGLKSAAAVFQRLVEKIVGNDLEPYVFCYQDDIIIATPDVKSHQEILDKVLRRLYDSGV